MKRFMMSVSDEMYEWLKQETKKRRLENIQETVRALISDIVKANTRKA